ncbi:MAG: helix-turn-helix transcriptional regulator [Planctomycetes bacterium]|nr:helix-turn-helix transcriptional regulator [Planctomycetota bacterium]
MIIEQCAFKPLTRHSVPSHSHDCLEWHYVIAGNCGFDIGTDRLQIKAGDLFAIHPHSEHGVRMRKRSDWLLQYIVHAKCEHSGDHQLWKSWQQQTKHNKIMHIGSGRHGLFARLSNALSSQNTWQTKAASLHFEALLCDCLSNAPAVEDTHPYIQQCLRYMHQSLYEILSIDDLAAHIGINKSYLIRLFKQHIGQSPLQYFTHLKMMLAGQLLRDEKLQVQEVAERIGYQAAAHFSRVFKKWSGMSPQAFTNAQ